ncbi:hypothetical protein Leryth_015088 [Lithospermum erythrorhizon]|nr:hypothetical protein Leryth_015088 [Lithospermum erythrorhizon]
MKSKILFWINEIDGRFRDLVLLVKEWARAHNINDPKAGTLNSYSLSLLVIFHFQTCVPAILPPIREIYPGNMVDDLRGVRADVEEHIKKTCEVQIYKFKTNRSRKINRSSLPQLFISFLAKFSDISLRAPSHGISIYNSQWEEIENNMSWLPKTYALFIEDPFEQPTNTARTVSNNQLKRISEAFQRSYQLLDSGSWNRFSLISTLAPPHTLRYLARTPAGSQYFNGINGFGTGPQVMHLPIQHQAMGKGPVMNQSNRAFSRFVQSTNGRSDGTSSRLVQSSNGRSNGASTGFVQSSNGRSNGAPSRFVQSNNGGRALQPPHQQKSQKTRIAEHKAGPSNNPVPQSSNGQKVKTWRPKTETVGLDVKK